MTIGMYATLGQNNNYFWGIWEISLILSGQRKVNYDYTTIKCVSLLFLVKLRFICMVTNGAKYTIIDSHLYGYVPKWIAFVAETKQPSRIKPCKSTHLAQL